MRKAMPDPYRNTILVQPLCSMEAIASQGVKRGQGSLNWYEAAPSLDSLVNKDHLYLSQRVANIMPARARSALEVEDHGGAVHSTTDPEFRSGLTIPTSQKVGRPATALPRVWSDANPWSADNGAIERNRVGSRTKIGSQPTDYEPPEEKITRYTKKYHHKLYPSRTSKRAPLWFVPVKNSDRHIFEKLCDDNPPEWFVDASTENPFIARSAARTGGIKNPAIGPNAGKQWSVTSLAAPEFMQIKGEPRRKVMPEGNRRVRPPTRSGSCVQGSRPNTGSRPSTVQSTRSRPDTAQAG